MTTAALQASINELATLSFAEVNSLVSEIGQSDDRSIVAGSTGLFTVGALDLL
jgi:hypothetical protein